MAQIKKQQFSYNLEKYKVLIEDTGTNSDYFKLANVPPILHTGKNYFLIAGTPLLAQNSKILAEVKDSKGNNIYSEVIDALIAGTFRLISIFIYSDTPIGDAVITIVGQAQKYTSGTIIPSVWQNKYNVRWTKSIKVDTLLGDDTAAIFVTQPKIEVTEIYDEVRTYDTVLVPVVWQVSGSGGINSGSGGARTSFGNMQSNAPYYIKIYSGSFTKDMEGGIVHFSSSYWTPFGLLKPFDTQIVKVVNENIAQVSPSYTYQYGYVNNAAPASDLKSPLEIPTLSEFTMSYVSKSINVGSPNKRISYLNVSVKNLDTYAGVVRYLDIFKQPGNLFLGRYPVIPNEKLCGGYLFNSVNDFTNNWVIPGQNQWFVEMTTTSSVTPLYPSAPTIDGWMSASLQYGILYSGLMPAAGINNPYTNSLSLYLSGSYSPYSTTVDFFNAGSSSYINQIAKFTTYVYATSSLMWSGSSVNWCASGGYIGPANTQITASFNDAMSIYVNGIQQFAGAASMKSASWAAAINSGSNKIDIYVTNTSGNIGFWAYKNISSYVYTMGAYGTPPKVDFDSTKLLNAIKIEKRMD